MLHEVALAINCTHIGTYHVHVVVNSNDIVLVLFCKSLQFRCTIDMIVSTTDSTNECNQSSPMHTSHRQPLTKQDSASMASSSTQSSLTASNERRRIRLTRLSSSTINTRRRPRSRDGMVCVGTTFLTEGGCVSCSRTTTTNLHPGPCVLPEW